MVKDCKEGGRTAVRMSHSGAGRVHYGSQQPHWVLVSYLGNDQGWSTVSPRFFPTSNLFSANDSGFYLRVRPINTHIFILPFFLPPPFPSFSFSLTLFLLCLGMIFVMNYFKLY